MKKIRAFAILNACTLFAHILISYSIQFGFLSEKTIGDIANTYPSLFSPAGLTYGIWGVIYGALAMFSVYHLYTSFRKDPDYAANRDIKDIGIIFILNNVVSIAWMLVWTDNQLLNSVVLILIQLSCLIMINIRLRIHDEHRKLASKAFTQFPFSIYFAWICVLALSNISSYLVANGWEGLGLGLTSSQTAIAFISVTILFTVLIVVLRRNVSFGLVIIWALYGIIIKRQEIGNELGTGVIETAWIGTGIVSLTCLAQMIRNFVYENMLNQDVPDYTQADEIPATVTANQSNEPR